MSCEPFHKGKNCYSSIFIIFCNLFLLSKFIGKVFVATATWNGLKVVIKSYKSKPDEYISLESNSSAEISTEEFKEMISQSLQVNFGETEYMSIHSLFPFLGNYDDLNNGTTMSKELMHNLYQLSQDNEYITLMLNRNSNHFPKGNLSNKYLF